MGTDLTGVLRGEPGALANLGEGDEGAGGPLLRLVAVHRGGGGHHPTQ